jgi:hypothetical protein
MSRVRRSPDGRAMRICVKTSPSTSLIWTFVGRYEVCVDEFDAFDVEYDLNADHERADDAEISEVINNYL